MALVTMGVQFGQAKDPTALCVAEIQEREVDGHHENHFMIRHLERLAIGTSFPNIARRVEEVAVGVRDRYGGVGTLYLNATGFGPPVVDLVRRRATPGTIIEVYFNHGDRRKVVDRREVRLGKAFVVARLQTLLQSNRVHLPPSQEARVLAEELMEYEIQVSEDANEKYGAFKVGTHDDLVTALGLALQEEGPRRAIILGG